MENKIKILGVLLFAGFSFFYTNKVSDVIRNNDPIMKEILNEKSEMIVNKIDRVVINDEYLTGINGCIIDEEKSYKKMRNAGGYKEELLTFKEDIIEKNNNKYIVGGNREKRNVSIILTSIYNDNYFEKNKIKINYFLDGDYIYNNIDSLIDISKYSRIYNYGRNKEYTNKYMLFDNTVIKTNFNNESKYCLVTDKDSDILKLCNTYKMDTLKVDEINNSLLTYVKENLSNGEILFFNNKKIDEIKLSINYILSKGYKIVFLDELLDESNACL